MPMPPPSRRLSMPLRGVAWTIFLAGWAAAQLGAQTGSGAATQDPGKLPFDSGGFSDTVYGGVTPRVPPPEIPSAAMPERGDEDSEVHTEIPDREFEQGRARSAGGSFLVHLPVRSAFKVFDAGFQYL